MSAEKILVVEDERLVAEDIAECLRGVGYNVIGTAKSSEEALAKVEAGRPDLVMMDITLRGDVDGIETAAILKERFSTPVIFLTAYSQKAVLDRAKHVEPLGYVIKPFDEGGLISTVEMALHKARMDHALRKSEEWFSTTLQSIGDGVIATDEEGRIRFLNRVAEQLTGWPANEAEGRDIREVFLVRAKADGAILPIPALQAMESGEIVELAKDAELLRRDDSRIDVDDSGAPIYDREGELAGSVLVFRDVTDSKLKAKEMESYREQLEQMVEERTAALNRQIGMESLMSSITADLLRVTAENWTEGFAQALERFAKATDLDGIGVWKTCFDPETGNVCVCKESAWSKPEFRRTDAESSQLPVGQMTWLQNQTDTHGRVAVASVAELPVEAAVERQVMEAGGIAAFVNLKVEVAGDKVGERCSLFAHAGQAQEWDEKELVFFEMLASAYKNTVERVAMEESRLALTAQLNQSQKLEAIGKLTGGIAHDFNNMLVPIIGYADEILSDGAKGDVEEEVTEIRRAAESAASLTRQLLAFSRKQVLQKRRVEIGKLVCGMQRLLERLIGENIHFQVNLDHEDWCVEADRSQLEQVLMNLCVNARDAMPNGGCLTVSTSCVSDSEGEPQICLEVADTGIGMSRDIVQKVFDPFFTTKGMEGTGLGLSVVLGIVEQHNGHVEVESVFGEGTRFTILLPAILKEAEDDTTDAVIEEGGERSLQGRQERILVVEDEPGVAQFVRRALERNSYEVHLSMTVTSGVEAFRADPDGFDMVLTDAMLPDGNGLDVVNAVRELRPKLPMLLSSGYTDNRSYLEEAARQDVPFLQKPYPLDDLYVSVRDALEGKRGMVELTS